MENTKDKKSDLVLGHGEFHPAPATLVTAATPPTPIIPPTPPELSMEYVLTRIDHIMYDSAHIHNAIEVVKNM